MIDAVDFNMDRLKDEVEKSLHTWINPTISNNRCEVRWKNPLNTRGILMSIYGGVTIWRKTEGEKAWVVTEPTDPIDKSGPVFWKLFHWMME